MRGGTKYSFKSVWKWPLDVETFVKERSKGKVLHVCCGSSEFGDVKIDKFVKREDIINLDAIENIPYKNEFDTVVCDPPWNLPYHLRPKLHRNLRDSLKPNGILLFNALWIPKAKGMKIKEMWLRVPKSFSRNCSIWTISERIQKRIDEF